MTNIYDFLRRVLNDANGQPGSVNITAEEMAWLEQFLTVPENQLHFKSRQVGYDDQKDEPIMALDFAIAGNPFEIFAMLTEAMVQNFQFAEIILKAAGFYQDHIPTCPECSKKHFGAVKPVMDWSFSPHKPQK